MNKKLRLFLIVLAVLAAFSVVRDMALGMIISSVASNVVGAPVRMGGFSLGLMRQSVDIRDLRIYNPPGFPKEPFVTIPRAAAQWKLADILQGHLHLIRVDFNLKELVVIKNKEGKTNIDSLKLAGQKQSNAKSGSQPIKMQIDRLALDIGRVVHKDYSARDPPVVTVRELGIKKEFKNISSGEQLALLILSEPMKSAGIQAAAIYSAAAMTGIGAVPVVARAILFGKDSAEAVYHKGFDAVYNACLTVLKNGGTLTTENRSNGMIKGEVSSSSITIQVEKTPDRTVKVIVSARKMMLPKPETAAGVLYQISERLK